MTFKDRTLRRVEVLCTPEHLDAPLTPALALSEG